MDGNRNNPDFIIQDQITMKYLRTYDGLNSLQWTEQPGVAQRWPYKSYAEQVVVDLGLLACKVVVL